MMILNQSSKRVLLCILVCVCVCIYVCVSVFYLHPTNSSEIERLGQGECFVSVHMCVYILSGGNFISTWIFPTSFILTFLHIHRAREVFQVLKNFKIIIALISYFTTILQV